MSPSNAPQKVAGVVVLFNPPASVLDNLRSYAGALEVLFAVDNSDGDPGALPRQLGALGNVVYVHAGGNVGVATALNLGAERAIKAGCDFLLTMDQDSRAEPSMVPRLLEAFDRYGVESLGLASPFPLLRFGEEPPQQPDMIAVLDVITSGSLLNLSAYQKVGRFLDELFIDCIDQEYCLRLALNGYQVVRVNSARLHHSLGLPSRHRFLFWNFTTLNHSNLRRYYMTRNRLHVTKLYRDAFPAFYRKKRRTLRREIPKLVLFEKDRLNKLRMILRGYRDYRAGRLGKYPA